MQLHAKVGRTEYSKTATSVVLISNLNNIHGAKILKL